MSLQMQLLSENIDLMEALSNANEEKDNVVKELKEMEKKLGQEQTEKYQAIYEQSVVSNFPFQWLACRLTKFTCSSS